MVGNQNNADMGLLTDKHTSFTLDDTLDDVLEMLFGAGALWALSLGQQHGVLHQSIAMVFGSIRDSAAVDSDGRTN